MQPHPPPLFSPERPVSGSTYLDILGRCPIVDDMQPNPTLPPWGHFRTPPFFACFFFRIFWRLWKNIFWNIFDQHFFSPQFWIFLFTILFCFQIFFLRILWKIWNWEMLRIDFPNNTYQPPALVLVREYSNPKLYFVTSLHKQKHI